MRFSAHQRLRKVEDFKVLLHSSLRINLGPFIAFLHKHPSGPCRLGIIASRKVGNAVVRNRAKRLFRAIFQKNYDTLPPSCDILIVVRSNFDQYSFSQLEQRFKKAANLLRNDK